MKKIKIISKIFFLVIGLNFVMFSFAVDNQKGDDGLEKEGELLDFQSIKDVLKNDGLDVNAVKKEKTYQKAKDARITKQKKMFDIPDSVDFWGFITELWLVKNAPLTRWDFQKPEYNLESSLAVFFEKMGVYERPFKILLVNSPHICHYALPGHGKEIIFLLSQPFIRTLDLSKLEISILLFEDYTRYTMDIFKGKVKGNELEKILGSNFDGKKFDVSPFNNILAQYDKIILEKGFSFNEQFSVTKRMGDILKSDMKLWNSYINLIKKIDELIKTNLLYAKYNDIYPSPELQLGWLVPKSRTL